MRIVLKLNTSNEHLVKDGEFNQDLLDHVAKQCVRDAMIYPYGGEMVDNEGNVLAEYHMRPVSRISKARAEEIVKQGSPVFGDYEKYMTEDEVAEVERLMNFNTSEVATTYSTLLRIAAGDYEK